MTRKAVFLMAALTVIFMASSGGLRGRLLPYITMPPQQVSVTQVRQNKGIENVVLDIQYPLVCGFDDKIFEGKLNTRMITQVNNAIADTFDQAKNNTDWVFVLRVSDDIKNNRGILSVRVTDDLDNGGTGFPRTVYYNVNIEDCCLITLDDLFVSHEYRTAIDGFIRGIVRNDEHYFADYFTGVSEKTAFFISGRQLHIEYAKYEIASGLTGEPDFAIPTLLIRKWLKPEYAPLFC